MAAFADPNNVDRLRQVDNIATDLNLIGGAALGDGPTGICHLLNAAHLIVELNRFAVAKPLRGGCGCVRLVVFTHLLFFIYFLAHYDHLI